MENKKIMVTSATSGRVNVNLPDLRLKRVWEKRGVSKPIDLDILKEAIYNPGVEYMFREGLLIIDDLDVKIELGLEPEGATEPENIIILNETQKKRLMTLAPLEELKEALGTLPYEQINELVSYAVENELTNIDRCELIKKTTGKDIIRTIQLRRQNEEKEV